MKGITPILAIIILIMASVGLSTIVYVHLLRMGSSSFAAAQNQTKERIGSIYQEIEIESVTSTEIFVRNKGPEDIPTSHVAVYVDGSLVEIDLASSSSTLPAGGVGYVKLVNALAPGEHIVKVTADSAKDVGIFNIG